MKCEILKTEQANGTRCLLMCLSSTLRPQTLSCELWANQRARSAWRHTHTHTSTHDRIMHWNTHEKHFIYVYISLYLNSILMTLIHMNIEIWINHLKHLIIVYEFNKTCKSSVQWNITQFIINIIIQSIRKFNQYLNTPF